MENSQLVEIFRTMTKTEFREFGKFLKSPYFNNRSEVVRYYDAVKGSYPKFAPESLEERIIFKNVYPGKKYSAVLMRKLISLTTGFAQDFLTIDNFKEQKLEYNVKLLDILRSRKLPVLFEKRTKLIDKIFSNSKHSHDYYEAKYKFTSTVNGYLLIKNEKSMVTRFQNELDDLIGYFLFVSLVQYIRLTEWSRSYNIKFDLKLYNEVLEFLSKNEYRESPLVTMYYKMLMLLNTGDEKYFFSLREERNTHEKILSPLDDYNIAIVSIQYCYKRVQNGDPEFRKHQFEITKQLLSNDLVPPGFIDPYFFTNIVRNAAYIYEFAWSEEFIETYSNKLDPEFRKETVNYSLAMVEFARHNFENALKLVSVINIERSNMKLDIKNMLLMIYYESGYTEELLSLIDTYKHFLQRDKEAAKQVIEKYMMFVKFVSALVKCSLSKNKEDILMLKKEVEKTPYFYLKDWLMEKVNSLAE